MNTNQKPAGNWITRAIVLLLGLILTAPAMAGLREPDIVIWGTIVVNKIAVTAANTDVSVEARRTLTGPAIATYRMGDNASAGDFYSLRLIAESGLPLTDPNAVLTGDSIYIVVLNSSGVQDSKPLVVGSRGSITRLDFGSLDTNNNGILDDWEIRYFGALGVNPNADPDGDGASNLREFLEGTNPNLADARHPADRNAIDGRITINEVTAYGLAWRNNLTWPVGPVPIPVAYVTKAGAIWKGGELYKLDTTVAPTAPLWWTNVTVAGLTEDGKKAQKAEAPLASTTVRSVSPSLAGGFVVDLAVTPATNVLAFAVEETIPAGWAATDISDTGVTTTPQNTIRWGVFFDSTPRHLTYRVYSLSGNPTAAVPLFGIGSFDGSDIAIGGVTSITDPSGKITLSISALAGASTASLTVRGLPGQSISILSSTNLVDWTPVKSASIGSLGSVQVTADVPGKTVFFRAATAP